MTSTPSTPEDHADNIRRFNELADAITGERQAAFLKKRQCDKIITALDAIVNYDIDEDVVAATLKRLLPIAADVRSFFSQFEKHPSSSNLRPYYYDRRAVRREWCDAFDNGSWYESGSLWKMLEVEK